MEKINEVQKAAYLEAYMAQQAAAFQHQNKFRYDNLPPQMEDKKKINIHSNGMQNVPGKVYNNVTSNCGSNYGTTIKVPQVQTTSVTSMDSTFTVPDDGLGFDDGVRVLRTLGSWTPDYRPTTGMLFPDLPYGHTDMNVNQRKLPTPVLPSPLPVPQTTTSTLTRPTPTIPQVKKEEINMNHRNQIQNHQPQQQQQQQPPPQQQQQQPPPPQHHVQTSKTNGAPQSVQNNSGTPSKSFTCTICGKSLARKDKLVIHTRIHTGEKPYVCEVCDKAFARRDKLVIHMNKMKHRTPTNIAPLGKRTNVDKSKVNKIEEEIADIPKTAALSIQTAAANWSCELCGQMMTTREEWMVHAKAHLEEKITGMGVISSNTYNNQRQVSNYPTNSVHIPPITPLNNTSYIPQHAGPYQPFNIAERQFCPVCRQAFSNKAEFMLHVRVHFDNVAKPHDATGNNARNQGSSGNSLIDNSAMCS